MQTCMTPFKIDRKRIECVVKGLKFEKADYKNINRIFWILSKKNLDRIKRQMITKLVIKNL